MYWKYHLEAGDAVKFKFDHPEHGRMRPFGTVTGIRDNHEEPPETVDDVDFEKIEVLVKSGQKDVEVLLEDVISRTKEEDRDTDLPEASEEFRFAGHIAHLERQRE